MTNIHEFLFGSDDFKVKSDQLKNEVDKIIDQYGKGFDQKDCYTLSTMPKSKEDSSKSVVKFQFDPIEIDDELRKLILNKFNEIFS